MKKQHESIILGINIYTDTCAILISSIKGTIACIKQQDNKFPLDAIRTCFATTKLNLNDISLFIYQSSETYTNNYQLINDNYEDYHKFDINCGAFLLNNTDKLSKKLYAKNTQLELNIIKQCCSRLCISKNLDFICMKPIDLNLYKLSCNDNIYDIIMEKVFEKHKNYKTSY